MIKDKLIRLGCILGVGFALGCSPSQPAALERSSQVIGPLPMPEFELRRAGGRKWNAAQFKGKAVVLLFWASWCAPCHELMPSVRQFAAQNRAGSETLLVSVDSDYESFSRSSRQLPDAPLSLFGGPAIVESWSLKQLPTLVLVRDTRILGRWEGKKAISTALIELDREIEPAPTN